MKLLFDQNLSFKLCKLLEGFFPGCAQVRLIGLSEADDSTISEYAKANECVIASLLRSRVAMINAFDQDANAACLEIY